MGIHFQEGGGVERAAKQIQILMSGFSSLPPCSTSIYRWDCFSFFIASIDKVLSPKPQRAEPDMKRYVVPVPPLSLLPPPVILLLSLIYVTTGRVA